MRAIVLGGGGTKGSYEIGAWQALRELGISYEIITGTSIGALNGAFMATNQFEQAQKLWKTIDVNNVVALEDRDETIRFLLKKGTLPHIIRKYLRYGGLDISPLKELIKKNISPSEIKNSPYQFGITTMQLPFMKGVEQDLKKTKKEEILHYLLASASCFPVFPACKINHNYYIDGGYYDNLPIDFALDLGADKIIAIDLDEKGTHPAYRRDKRIEYILPSRNLGPFLFFHRETIEQNRILGYLDTMRHFRKFDGIHFAFEKENTKLYQNEIKQFLEHIRVFQAHYQVKLLLEEEDERESSFLFQLFLEEAMEYFQESPYRLYQKREIIDQYRKKDTISFHSEDRNIFDQIATIYDLYELINQRGKWVLLKFLNFYLFEKQWNFPFVTDLLLHFRKEILILLLLKSL